MELSVSVTNIRREYVDAMSMERRAYLDIYFSIKQENDLVLQTLNILKEAKLRK